VKIRRKLLGLATAIGVACSVAVLGQTVPAFAINRAYPCDTANSGNYLEFFASGGNPCFANAGTMRVDIYGVTDVLTGNNSGYFRYDGGTEYFSKGQHLPPNGNYGTPLHVTYIRIY
jgi:hypothetical protein